MQVKELVEQVDAEIVAEKSEEAIPFAAHIPTGLRNAPWLTEGAIRFLESFLKPEMRVLEFGAGASTLWLADRVAEVVSVEGAKPWHDLLTEECKSRPNVRLIFCERYNGPQREYPDGYFDLVLVDGRNRARCFADSDRVLRSGGVMMLDNSERKKYLPFFEHYPHPSWSAEQLGPDSLGFWYSGWTTKWWIKR